ncbi:MAG: hypothetical protein ACI4WU_04755 [Bacilli bacterium]
MGFKTGQNKLVLDINNKEYKVSITENLVKRFREKQVELVSLKDNIGTKEVIFIVKEIVELILGKNEFNIIFGEDENNIDVYDVMDLVNYLCEEIEKFKVKKVNKYTNIVKRK